MTTSLIAFGGNTGDVPGTYRAVRAALDGLHDAHVDAASSLHRTEPIGKDAGDPFQNAALLVTTTRSAADLLSELHRIEDDLGRVRTVRWGPRTIDLDLILHGETVITSETLTVPHPAAWHRRFVLDPACEIAPELPHPERGVTLAELRSRLLVRPLTVRLVDADHTTQREFRTVVEAHFGNLIAFVTDEAAAVTFDVRLSRETPWESLPVLSRLDLSATSDPIADLLDVLRSALDV